MTELVEDNAIWLDSDGYPTMSALKRIANWPHNDFRGLMAFVKSLWLYSDMGRFWEESDENDEGHGHPIRKYALSTAGWSGNESLIHALRENFLFWSFCWVQHRRGGHFIFHVRKDRP